MTTKEEKRRRREINQKLKREERARAEAALPLDKSTLQNLFDYVDRQLEVNGCDHTLRAAQEFIEQNGLPEEAIIDWLEKYGGYCDCEVIANVEEYW